MLELRAKQIRQMSKEERQQTLKNLKESLLHERALVSMGGSSPSPGKVRSIRRQIARLLTVEREEKK
ncbi:ribosomal protein large subunit L35 [Thermoplasma volcanium GSS1]|uniref:Large ribosomal subunit protein uL29 n=2 Tax=Thermoplasma volcanium TaxID=50339 RepID=RL29_THEVO|nr:RecName: Full=Large ribosomal subunit protein uL29; AltName: Full=50S ribosomal protein L29 [Thermoplasma volcanium GSS1]BAB59477.1 ribosomal protein large subunit L35 [Thermoplasma volcanium GSS1]